ncbi:tetratricopeptide repeat protein [Gordonia sp. TBRC 11910]|uniref:Tetratricopeptide repeat protein n=1 Tax=Gordonia asplenii TaxID=2725283 RepID=A0A848L0M2_9ACTN|nr:tetratricopeptide repeat protein [Gordonia asplenii]NMO04356.1 tetratricopeptide repeat protein [Gordonia asplenii]
MAGPASTDNYYDLGTYRRDIDTTSPDAQVWFGRGLVWAYAFNHEEAIRCFEHALTYDPGLAIAHWGIAYAVGPNYNKGWDAFDPVDLAESLHRARAELDLAATGRANDIERGLISSLRQRFPSDDNALTAGHAAYADAMTGLAAAYPGDLDVVALAADAQLNVTAWALWDGRTGLAANGSRVADAIGLLESALSTPAGRSHPGVLHLYLHAMEMSATPEAALPAADLLRGLVPDAGHLQHMPSHIDVLCGNYHDGIVANQAAVQADRKYLADRGAIDFYALYRAHDLHFIVYCAMFAGDSAIALEAADELRAQLTPELLSVTSPPMADWLEAFVPLRVHVLIRFGRWAELIACPLPDDVALYATTCATVHYGRGIALAATGDIEAAKTARSAFVAAHAAIPASRYLFNNSCRDILAVAAAMLDGEIAYREGDFDAALRYLQRAVELDDALPYDEPWGWMQPTRHAYGALLLEQGRVAEAASVYAADLGYDPAVSRSSHHPNNVWSLHGYHECLQRLGRDDEAVIVGQQLKLALARADVPIEASCACRLSSGGCC